MLLIIVSIFLGLPLTTLTLGPHALAALLQRLYDANLRHGIRRLLSTLLLTDKTLLRLDILLGVQKE